MIFYLRTLLAIKPLRPEELTSFLKKQLIAMPSIRGIGPPPFP